MSLLGTACMAGSESNIATEKSKEIKGNTIPKTEQLNVSKKKIDPPTITLKKDITKHPFLWIGFSVSPIVSFILSDTSASLITGLSFNKNQTQNLENLKSNLIIEMLTLLLVVGIHAVVSILLATWKCRWENKGEEENNFVMPSFKIRFWRSFRFMLPLAVITPISAICLELFEYYCFIINEDLFLLILPVVIAILSYLGIRVYDFKQGQKEERKPIPKRIQSLIQKTNPWMS